MNLAQCANLGTETHATFSAVLREEQRRCFWSICLLKRFHGVDFDSMGLPDGSFPPFPQSPERPQSPFSPSGASDEARSTGMEDQGIIAYVIILSEVFAKTTKYVRRHAGQAVSHRGPHSQSTPKFSRSKWIWKHACLTSIDSNRPTSARGRPRSFKPTEDTGVRGS